MLGHNPQAILTLAPRPPQAPILGPSQPVTHILGQIPLPVSSRPLNRQVAHTVEPSPQAIPTQDLNLRAIPIQDLNLQATQTQDLSQQVTHTQDHNQQAVLTQVHSQLAIRMWEPSLAIR